jgi:hypothetical protein
VKIGIIPESLVERLALAPGAHAPAADPQVDGTRSGAQRGSEAGVNRHAVAKDVWGLRHLSQRAAGNSGKFNARCAENRPGNDGR